ncbi:MAG: hypothetical protein Q8P59_13925 [Dehalococcoidia bacterium]|nr:hypothetical protein [Dehalococcoidia bacterium]
MVWFLMGRNMSECPNRPSDTAKFRSMWARLAYFLVIAAAGLWLAACSGAALGVPAAEPTITGARSNPPSSAQPKNPNAPAGESLPTISSPAGVSSTDSRPVTLTAKDQGQGGITIKATWVVPGSPEASTAQLDRYVALKLTLDTHSGDLTRYDLTKVSVLRDDKGKESLPAAWENISNDSHHREGILRFPKGAERGSKYVELLIRDVGGAKERVLRWDLGG